MRCLLSQALSPKGVHFEAVLKRQILEVLSLKYAKVHCARMLKVDE